MSGWLKSKCLAGFVTLLVLIPSFAHKRRAHDLSAEGIQAYSLALIVLNMKIHCDKGKRKELQGNRKD